MGGNREERTKVRTIVQRGGGEERRLYPSVAVPGRYYHNESRDCCKWASESVANNRAHDSSGYKDVVCVS